MEVGQAEEGMREGGGGWHCPVHLSLLEDGAWLTLTIRAQHRGAGCRWRRASVRGMQARMNERVSE